MLRDKAFDYSTSHLRAEVLTATHDATGLERSLMFNPTIIMLKQVHSNIDNKANQYLPEEEYNANIIIM